MTEPAPRAPGAAKVVKQAKGIMAAGGGIHDAESHEAHEPNEGFGINKGEQG